MERQKVIIDASISVAEASAKNLADDSRCMFGAFVKAGTQYGVVGEWPQTITLI